MLILVWLGALVTMYLLRSTESWIQILGAVLWTVVIVGARNGGQLRQLRGANRCKLGGWRWWSGVAK